MDKKHDDIYNIDNQGKGTTEHVADVSNMFIVGGEVHGKENHRVIQKKI